MNPTKLSYKYPVKYTFRANIVDRTGQDSADIAYLRNRFESVYSDRATNHATVQ